MKSICLKYVVLKAASSASRTRNIKNNSEKSSRLKIEDLLLLFCTGRFYEKDMQNSYAKLRMHHDVDSIH